MNIKDYLRYFIGQKVLINNARYENKVDVLTHLNDGGDCAGNEYEWDASNCQIILRRLEDMTEDEDGAIFQLERNRNPELGGHDFDVRKGDNGWIITRLDMLESHLMVGFKGQAYWVYDVPKQHIEPVLNAPLLFHWLLSHGFDLFGLIDAGLAIDSKTVNTI